MSRRGGGGVVERPQAVGLRTAINGDGSLVATTSYDGRAMLWDASTGRQVLQLDAVEKHTGMAGIAFAPMGRRAAAAAAPAPSRWSLPAGTLIRPSGTAADTEHHVVAGRTPLAVGSPDGACGSDAATGKIARLAHCRGATVARFSRDGG
jgi:WD40 repeat protein